MLQKLRESLALFLIGFLPFHALFVTVATKLVKGPGHAPMAALALWKEALLGIVLLIALWEMAQASGKRKAERGKGLSIDVLDMLILALLFLSILVTVGLHSSLGSVTLGFKYDFLPLCAFLVLRRVPWSEMFFGRVKTVLLWVGSIIAGYGILSFLLPEAFFASLGYSDQHSLYISNGPLAAFQQIGGSMIRRIQSTMSGPNQLGLWLLLPWTLCVSDLLHRKVLHHKLPAICYLLSALIALAILLTFSRSAWIGAVVIVLVALYRSLSQGAFRKAASGLVAVSVLVGVVLLLIKPSVLLRLSSNRGHWERPMAALQMIAAHPLGMGLGTAGPASNRGHDTCVYLEESDDPSWAKDNPALCVFVGKTQVQPSQPCNCPFLPENWYLQIGVELGAVGMLLWIALTLWLLKILWRVGERGKVIGEKASFPFHFSLFTFFLAISVAALFLHAWEDAAVAYSAWILVAAALPVRIKAA